MYGNVGVKVRPEDVEVTPSREGLVWNEVTKKMILARFKDAAQSASTLISKELSHSDFIAWYRNCSSVLASWSSDQQGPQVLSALSGIVDTNKLKPKFNPDPEIHFSFKLFEFTGISCRTVVYETLTKNNKTSKVIKRNDSKSLHETVILKLGPTSNRKDKYLLSQFPKFTMLEHRELFRVDKEGNPVMPEALQGYKDGKFKSESADFADRVWRHLLQSEGVLTYEDIDVPEDFTGNDTEETEELELETMTEEQLAEIKLTLAERRKLQGKTILYTPAVREVRAYDKGMHDGIVNGSISCRYWLKVEIPYADIDNWQEEEIYYGNDADKQTLEFVSYLMRDTRSLNYHQWRGNCPKEYTTKDGSTYDLTGVELAKAENFFNCKIRLVKVAQDRVKLYKDFKHINKFFARMNGSTLTMSNSLVKWNTARQIQQKLHHLDFMMTFSMDPERQTKYKALREYVKENYREFKLESQAYDDMLAHLDKVQQFQLLVSSGASSEDIATVAKEMWGSAEVKDGYAIDLSVTQVLDELLDWSAPVRVLLNGIGRLTRREVSKSYTFHTPTESLSSYSISEELESAVISYCRANNVI